MLGFTEKLCLAPQAGKVQRYPAVLMLCIISISFFYANNTQHYSHFCYCRVHIVLFTAFEKYNVLKFTVFLS